MQNYNLDEQAHFIIKDYQHGRPFASFLPGIAGKMGIPLWVFYVNRGQAIASFGVENKDQPIMEYQTANRAYQLTPYLGFRTFIKLQQGNRSRIYEPFSTSSDTQKMIIGLNELRLEEINPAHGLRTEITYFLLPEENLAGLVRMVTITNQSERPVHFEILDGLPAVIPFGVNNQLLKEIGRTVEAWMEVYNLDQNIPYYRLRASVADTNEVSSIYAGHFMLTLSGGDGVPGLLPVIIDPVLVFGRNTALITPEAFKQYSLRELLGQKQITCGRTPCGFSAAEAQLVPGESFQMNSLFGHVSSLENIQSQVKQLSSANYFQKKRQEADALVCNLTEAITCHTGSKLFDAYCRQTFLDNILRGGWPVVFGKGKNPIIYHIYSRKHGDLERDYNAFSFAPEFYSQGNGSYRDINQNRREDIWFFPDIGDFNIHFFMSLIQADGYNPLVIQGSSFNVRPRKMKGLLTYTDQPEKLRRLFLESFTPGSLLKGILDESIRLTIDYQTFLEKVLEESEQHIEATCGDGYWIDHWTYNLDLIESYLAVYPDRQEELFFLEHKLPFYDNALVVKPRSKKYILLNGIPRQLGSLSEDQHKSAMIAARRGASCWVRTDHGKGSIYRTTLFAKLFCLALIKFATMDPWGMGIEMEASRPGWDDAMNGLPALFGSSMAETFSLKWLLKILEDALFVGKSHTLFLPVEVIKLFHRLTKEVRHFQLSNSTDRDHDFWDHVSSAREQYRSSIRMGFDGREAEVAFSELKSAIGLFQSKIEAGISRALDLNNDLPPTYFTYQIEKFDLLKDRKGHQVTDSEERPFIRIKRCRAKPLPMFLEGAVRAMKGLNGASAEKLYDIVKTSALFDSKLKMYKINASLNGLPKDIGRARAFTPGWLENESIWLHMEYKYLLEVLRAGLYERFYEDFKVVLVPFLDPTIYGRSPLENSSFIVSSAHPDELLHGAGFVARLSGASAEFLSMWRLIMAGALPFTMKDGELNLVLEPILPAWLFDETNKVSFKFLGRTTVTYHNPKRMNTFDPGIMTRSTILNSDKSDALEFPGNVIPAPYAQNVRVGKVDQIDVYFA